MASPTVGEIVEVSFFLAITLITAGLVVRAGLIAAGLLKTPVMLFLAQYNSDDSYFLLPQALLVCGAFVIAISALVAQFVPGVGFFSTVGVLITVLAYGAWLMRDNARERPGLWMPVPAWLVRLREETTREERRRIAFLWLMLPRRARWHYDISGHDFMLWCDLIIMGTVTQTMDDESVRQSGQVATSDLVDRLYP